jgi:tetratricopeptide (TPR) repeat protein
MLNLSAQNIDDMMEMITGGKLKEAKDAVDKYLSNPKKQNDPDGWYVKGKVYNALSKESTNTFVQSFSMKMEALEAFQKNQSLDKKDVRMKLEEYIPYFDIYAELYNAGIKNYNDKDFEGAFTAFKKTNEVKDFILSKGYKNEQIPLVTFDTALIMNVAICAYNAKREADMYEFYKKIIQFKNRQNSSRKSIKK